MIWMLLGGIFFFAVAVDEVDGMMNAGCLSVDLFRRRQTVSLTTPPRGQLLLHHGMNAFGRCPFFSCCFFAKKNPPARASGVGYGRLPAAKKMQCHTNSKVGKGQRRDGREGRRTREQRNHQHGVGCLYGMMGIFFALFLVIFAGENGAVLVCGSKTARVVSFRFSFVCGLVLFCLAW